MLREGPDRQPLKQQHPQEPLLSLKWETKSIARTLPALRPSPEAPWQLDLPCPFPYLLSLFVLGRMGALAGALTLQRTLPRTTFMVLHDLHQPGIADG